MGMDMVLGASLHEAVVTDASILGGHVMRAYVADWSGNQRRRIGALDRLAVLDVQAQ